MFCQICCNPNVAMYKVCQKCNWQNDKFLETHQGDFVSVSYRLSEQEKKYWSNVNHTSPKDWIKVENCSEDLINLLQIINN